MIIANLVLSLTLSYQKPEVTSPPAPAFKTFLANLPTELRFLQKWPTYKISELMVSRKVASAKPVTKWFYQYEFMIGPYERNDKAIPQKWARQLKQSLTVRKGWKLEFPEVGTYNANAVRTSNEGTPDWTVRYRSWYGRSYIFIYNQTKPIRSE